MPLLKKTGLDVHNVTSYRPVLNLPHLSKILERIINCLLVSHLEEFRLLPEVQSAYRRGHSTETAVLKVFSDLVDAISNGKFALLSLLDLSVAFDTVDTYTCNYVDKYTYTHTNIYIHTSTEAACMLMCIYNYVNIHKHPE